MLQGLKRGARFFVASVLVAGCAVGPRTVPMIINGKKMATFEPKGDHYGVTVFDLKGRMIYSSDFRGGCKGIPQAGWELIGTKFRYDSLGNFTSKWEIAPDTSRSVFTETFGHGKGTRSTRYVYKYANLDSIIYLDSLDRIIHVDNFGGQVCINFSEFYVSALNGFSMFYDQGKPYLFDTAVREDFSAETGKPLFRHIEKPDSLIQVGYYKNGNVKSRLECPIVSGKRCESALTDEWFESGKISVEQKQVGNRIVHRHYYENGNPMTESFYLGAKLDSTYRSWYENGKPDQKIEYRLGVELKSEEWDKDGKKIR